MDDYGSLEAQLVEEVVGNGAPKLTKPLISSSLFLFHSA
jgi:hypothetical protein